MKLEICEEEYEETAEAKLAGVCYEVSEALRRSAYVEERYAEKQQTIRNRWKNLTMAIWVHVGFMVLLFGLSGFFSVFMDSVWSAAFCLWTVWLFAILGAWQLSNVVRVLAAYGTHLCKINPALRLIWNRKTDYRILERFGVYTLQEEAADCAQQEWQLKRYEKELRDYLEREAKTEAEGKEILQVLVPAIETLLDASDKRATYLYGERI